MQVAIGDAERDLRKERGSPRPRDRGALGLRLPHAESAAERPRSPPRRRLLPRRPRHRSRPQDLLALDVPVSGRVGGQTRRRGLPPRRDAYHAFAIAVLACTTTHLTHISLFATPTLFERFALPRRSQPETDSELAPDHGAGSASLLAGTLLIERAHDSGCAGDATGYAREATARPNGLPSESRQIDHRSPGWIVLPPSAATFSSAAAISATVKYGSEAVSPGPAPRS